MYGHQMQNSSTSSQSTGGMSVATNGIAGIGARYVGGGGVGSSFRHGGPGPAPYHAGLEQGGGGSNIYSGHPNPGYARNGQPSSSSSSLGVPPSPYGQGPSPPQHGYPLAPQQQQQQQQLKGGQHTGQAPYGPPSSSAAEAGGAGALGGSASQLPNEGNMNGPASSAATGAAGNSMNGMQRTRSRRPDAAEIRRVGRIHYEELLKFLRSHLAKGQRGPRTNAREKLTRLSQQQFTELSTDVYDELMRRINNSRTGQDVPHLAVREEFHPKRNQARQKLATLPRTRFKDLSSDVFFELERRFPELREEFRPDALSHDQEIEQKGLLAEGAGNAQQDVARTAEPELQEVVDDQDRQATSSHQRQNSTLSARSIQDSAFAHASHNFDNESTRGDPTVAQPSTTDVVVPAKSSLVEEEIEMPLAQVHDQDDSDEAASPVDAGNGGAERGASLDEKRSSIDEHADSHDPDVARSTMYSQASSIGTGFYQTYGAHGRADSMAAASPNLNGVNSARNAQAAAAELEKVRADYEYKIATFQQKLTSAETRNAELERDLAALSSDADATKEAHEDRARTLQAEADKYRSLHDDKHAELQSTLSRLEQLQGQHDDLQRSRATDQTSVAELEALRKDHAEQSDLVSELRSEVTNLVDELRQLSTRNDELLGEKESHEAVVRDLNNQVATYKRKYEAAKTELRSLKATSQLFVQQLKPDDDLVASDNGAIADVSLTAFQSSIDELLASARARNVSNVLTVYRSVVLSATLIMEDIGKHERDTPQMSPQDREQLYTGKNKISTTLNNLMIACRNHAAGGGLSPVGLVDAAASHVSAAVVDIAKQIKIRKATDEERADFEATFTQNGTLPNGLKPLHTNVLSGTQSHSRDTFQPPAPADARRRNVELTLDQTRLGTPNQNDPSRPHSPNPRNGSLMGRYSPVGYNPVVGNKGSNGEGSWKSPRLGIERNRHPSSSSNGSAVHTADKLPAVPSIDAAMQRAASSSRSVSSSTSASRSPYTGAFSHVLASTMAGNPVQPPASSLPLQEQTKDSNGSPPGPRGSSAHSNTSTPPRVPSFVGEESGEEHWGEMRNYIEVQTEAIVHCIQALLSSIREGAQGNQLHENLTQITTIVSSIIAISKDNIPRAAAAAAAASHGDEARTAQASATAAAECERILQELSDHCEKLIDMQSIGGQFDKTTKSNMASASYGVAKGLKALNGLLTQSAQ